MSALIYEEACYDDALRNCGMLHQCPRCLKDYEHEIDTRDCRVDEDRDVCDSCALDVLGCSASCANRRDENAEHARWCPNREELP